MKDILRRWLPITGLVLAGGVAVKGLYDVFTTPETTSVSENTPTPETINPNLVVAGGGEATLQPEAQPTQAVIISTQPPVDNSGLPYKGNDSCRIVAETGEVFYITRGRPSTVQGHVCLGRDGDGLNWWLANEVKIEYDVNQNGILDKAVMYTKD